MKYIVSDQFGGGAGWTADKFAQALKEPLAEIGIGRVRARTVRVIAKKANIPLGAANRQERDRVTIAGRRRRASGVWSLRWLR